MPNAKNTAAPETAVKKAEPTYTKDQVAVSKRYANRRDLVNTLLEDGKAYTLAEVDALIDRFMKGAVK